MSRFVHFEINASDLEKTVAFYREVFGWEINKWDGPMNYWLVKTGGTDEYGINGAIFNSEGMFQGTVNTLDVPDLKAHIEKVKASGGKVLGEINFIPGVGHFTYCADVEGNLFGMLEPDPAMGQQG
jgi:uncharacterized protein